MFQRPIANDFLTVTKPFVDKVMATKDLKTVRTAQWFKRLTALRGIVNMLEADRKTAALGAMLLIPALRQEIAESDIGGKAIRADIWRRLIWIELTINMSKV